MDRPEWPPPEVWLEVDEAARAWERLRDQGREVHFEPNPATGRVEITLRDSDGNVTPLGLDAVLETVSNPLG